MRRSLVVGAAGVAFAMLAVLLSPVCAADAADSSQFTGIATHLDEKLISVQNGDGKTRSFHVTAETTFGTKKKPQKITDFKVTDKVTITYGENDKGELTAQNIIRAKK